MFLQGKEAKANTMVIQNFCAFTGLFNFLTCSGLSLFLYFRNPSGKMNRSFAIWSASVAFWAFGYFMWLFAIPYDTSLFWIRFLMVGAIVIPTTYIHFTLVFLNRDEKYRFVIYLCYLFSGAYVILDFTPLFISYQVPRYWFRWWPVPGPLYHIYSTLALFR